MLRIFLHQGMLAASLVLASALPAAQQPSFKTSVDLVRVDVTVVDDDGNPVPDLEQADFEVSINGTVRPVTALRYLEFASLSEAAAAGAAMSSTAGPGPGGRIIVIAVDEESLSRQDSARPLMQTLAAWIDRLTPADRMSIVALPPPGVKQKLTSDKAALKRTLYKLHYRAPVREMQLGVQGFGANGATTASPRPDEPGAPRRRFATPEAFSTFSSQGMLLIGLEDLAASLVRLEGPKTLVLVSGTLGFDPDLLSRYRAMASRASEARLRMYVLQPNASPTGASGNREEQIADSRGASPEGLHLLAGLTGGAVFPAIGTAKGVVTRVERETTGVYVVGVELAGDTPRNKPLTVKVRVTRPNVTVRSPQSVIPPRS